MHAATRKHSFRASISIINDDDDNHNDHHDNNSTPNKKLKATDMESDFISFK